MTSLEELMRAVIRADAAMRRANGADEWLEAFDIWFHAKREKEWVQNPHKLPPRLRAEDFEYMKTKTPAPATGRAERKKNKMEEVEALEREVGSRMGTGDLDFGPLPRVSVGSANNKAYELKRRLAMKADRVDATKK